MNPASIIFVILLVGMVLPVILLLCKVKWINKLRFRPYILLLLSWAFIYPAVVLLILNTYWIDTVTATEEVCEVKTITIWKWKSDK